MTYQISKSLHDELVYAVKKRTGLEDRKHDVRHIVIGSSHGDYGFFPDDIPGSYNLCTPSQDLLHSALLYQYAGKMCQNLEAVIVFYSVFSPGFYVAKTSEMWRGAALKEVFGLDIVYDDDLATQTYCSCAGISANVRFPIETFGRLQGSDAGGFPAEYGAERRATEHLKHNSRGGQDIHLLTILGMAAARHQKMIVVIPPARSDYRSFLPPPTSLYSSLYRLQDAVQGFGQFEIVNLFDSHRFSESDFCDYDHLIPCGAGARLLTAEVAKTL